MWKHKKCGCVKARLAPGRVTIRCSQHRGKTAKKGRLLAYFGESTIVTREPK